MTFFLIFILLKYFSNENLVELTSFIGLFGYIVTIVILAFAGALSALVISWVDRRRSPFRLFFGGYFILYLPWMLLYRAI